MSRPRCGATSGRSCSRRPCRARCVSPRRRATVSPRSRTTAALPAPTRTGRWRWSLSSAARKPGGPGEGAASLPVASSPAPPATQRRGLGRGLEVLMGGLPEASSELAYLPIAEVHPNPRQPRRRFEPEAHAGLADSIKAQGVVQPVLVRPRPAGGYELIAGERRWRAAREAGLERVPAAVRLADDRDTLLLGLVENVAREALSPVEEARAYAVLVDEFGLSLGEIAETLERASAP